WHEQEMNSHWASPAELQAIRQARKAGVVTRLYNPPIREAPEGAPVLVYASDGEGHERLQGLLAAFAGRWTVDAQGAPRLAICAAESQGRISPANYRGGVFDPPLAQLARAALAREGFIDEAAAPIAVTERSPLELEAEVAGRRYLVRLKLAQVEFFGSCSAM